MRCAPGVNPAAFYHARSAISTGDTTAAARLRRAGSAARLQDMQAFEQVQGFIDLRVALR